MTKIIIILVLVFNLACTQLEEEYNNSVMEMTIDSSLSNVFANIESSIGVFDYQELPFVISHTFHGVKETPRSIYIDAMTIDHNTDISIQVLWNGVLVIDETMPAIIGEHTVIKTSYDIK